jgi:hypothetical protein
MAEMTIEVEAAAVIRGASVAERKTLKSRSARITTWLQNLEKEIAKYD